MIGLQEHRKALSSGGYSTQQNFSKNPIPMEKLYNLGGRGCFAPSPFPMPVFIGRNWWGHHYYMNNDDYLDDDQ